MWKVDWVLRDGQIGYHLLVLVSLNSHTDGLGFWDFWAFPTGRQRRKIIVIGSMSVLSLVGQGKDLAKTQLLLPSVAPSPGCGGSTGWH